MKIKLDQWKDLAARAVTLVREAEASDLSNADKRRTVVNALAQDVDTMLTFGDGPVGRMLEFFDGPVIRLVLTALVEGVVAALKIVQKQVATAS